MTKEQNCKPKIVRPIQNYTMSELISGLIFCELGSDDVSTKAFKKEIDKRCSKFDEWSKTT